MKSVRYTCWGCEMDCPNPHFHQPILGNIKVLAICSECMQGIKDAHCRMVSDRTKAALAAAKARGVKLGNPNPERAVKAMVAENVRAADEFAESLRPLVERILHSTPATSLAAIATALTKGAHPTRRGKFNWQPSQAMHLLRRLGLKTSRMH